MPDCGIFSTDNAQSDRMQIEAESLDPDEFFGKEGQPDNEDPCYCRYNDEGELIECGYCRDREALYCPE